MYEAHITLDCECKDLNAAVQSLQSTGAQCVRCTFLENNCIECVCLISTDSLVAIKNIPYVRDVRIYNPIANGDME